MMKIQALVSDYLAIFAKGMEVRSDQQCEKKQFQIVSSLLNRPDVTCIYVCTDSGRRENIFTVW